jgi:hypothetical protein
MLHCNVTFRRVTGFLLAPSTILIGLGALFVTGSMKAQDTPGIANSRAAQDPIGVPENMSRIGGSVTGPDGTGVANATVTATNVNTKAVATTTTAIDGSYVISNLTNDSYKLAVQAAGFKKATAVVEAHDAQEINVDIKMKSAQPNFFEKLLLTGAVLAGDAYLNYLQDKTDDAASADQSDQDQNDERADRDTRQDYHRDRHEENDQAKHKASKDKAKDGDRK